MEKDAQVLCSSTTEDNGMLLTYLWSYFACIIVSHGSQWDWKTWKNGRSQSSKQVFLKNKSVFFVLFFRVVFFLPGKVFLVLFCHQNGGFFCNYRKNYC